MTGSEHPHLVYIAAAYGFAAVVLGALVIHTLALRAKMKKAAAQKGRAP